MIILVMVEEERDVLPQVQALPRVGVGNGVLEQGFLNSGGQLVLLRYYRPAQALQNVLLLPAERVAPVVSVADDGTPLIVPSRERAGQLVVLLSCGHHRRSLRRCH
jgi:hypothetical protein